MGDRAVPRRIRTLFRQPRYLGRTLLVVGTILVLLGIGVSVVPKSDETVTAALRGYLRVGAYAERYYPFSWGQRLYIHPGLPLLYRLGLVRPVRVPIEPGVNVSLDPTDLVDRGILRYGAWEVAVWQSIADGLPEGGVFLDVGAHIGFHSLKAAVKVGPNGHVVSFEPNPTTLQRFQENITASRASNITVQPIACTEREQKLTLHGGPSFNSGMASLSEATAGRAGASVGAFTVQGRPIDHVIPELKLQRVDVIKIDVEGAELQVLRGARETILRFHPKLVLEVIPNQLAEMGTTVADLMWYLQDLGYQRNRNLDPGNMEFTVD